MKSWLAMLRLGENEHARKRLADLMLRLGRHAEAVPHLRALAEMRPIEAERWTRLAQTLNNVGDVAGEREAWLRVLSRGSDLTAHARLADLFLAADLVADAIPHVRALAESAPDDFAKWKRLAQLLRQTGDATGERDAWLSVLAATSSAEAHFRLADLFLAENSLVEAAAHVRALAEARPGKAGHWRRLAHLLQRSGDAGGEAEAWHHVLQLIDDEEAHSRLAKLLPALGRSQEAVVHLRALAEAAPADYGRWIDLAESLRSLGRAAEERDAWVRVLATGGSITAHARLADLFLAEGSVAAAIPHLRALAENDPRDADSWIRLALVLRQAGDSKAEVEAWQYVLSKCEHETGRARLADLFLAADRVADAIPHVRALAESAPEDVAKWKRLAQLLRQTGDATGERDAWLNVLAATSSAEAHFRLADLFLAENCLVEGAAHVRALAEARPGKAGHWRRLAHLLQRSGDAGGEVQAWQRVLRLTSDIEAHERLAILLPGFGRAAEVRAAFARLGASKTQRTEHLASSGCPAQGTRRCRG